MADQETVKAFFDKVEPLFYMLAGKYHLIGMQLERVYSAIPVFSITWQESGEDVFRSIHVEIDDLEHARVELHVWNKQAEFLLPADGIIYIGSTDTWIRSLEDQLEEAYDIASRAVIAVV